MPRPEELVPLPGSARERLPGATPSRNAEQSEEITVTLVLRPRRAKGALPSIDALNSRLPHERTYLAREELEKERGASPADVAAVRSFATKNGLMLEGQDLGRRSVILRGNVGQFNRAFGINLMMYSHPNGEYRSHEGPILLPKRLAAEVVAVLGLDTRIQAKPHMRIVLTGAGLQAYLPTTVAGLYHFPSGANGRGECIGIIELGGGYSPSDLERFFENLGLPTPSVTPVSVDGGANAPTGNPNGPDAEVDLDIEIAGSVAPGGRIAVYFAPNTEQGFVDAVSTAIHDAQNDPSVISISWGEAEANWSPQGIQALNQAFEDASLLGVTVCAAAGDNGSSDGISDGLAHVDFPASSPYVLGCGGTRLESMGGAITAEVVWNDQPEDGATGGGVSDVFPLPGWQANAKVPPSANPGGHTGRGVPDTCADADPATGYLVQVDGRSMTIGGTSAAAPLWAGLVALLNQKLGKRLGCVNPVLYSQLAKRGVFHDITSGNNGAYTAAPGWDACSGWGSPDGVKIAASLSQQVQPK
jgi:kumamolisin